MEVISIWWLHQIYNNDDKWVVFFDVIMYPWYICAIGILNSSITFRILVDSRYSRFHFNCRLRYILKFQNIPGIWKVIGLLNYTYCTDKTWIHMKSKKNNQFVNWWSHRIDITSELYLEESFWKSECRDIFFIIEASGTTDIFIYCSLWWKYGYIMSPFNGTNSSRVARNDYVHLIRNNGTNILVYNIII